MYSLYNFFILMKKWKPANKSHTQLKNPFSWICSKTPTENSNPQTSVFHPAIQLVLRISKFLPLSLLSPSYVATTWKPTVGVRSNWWNVTLSDQIILVPCLSVYLELKVGCGGSLSFHVNYVLCTLENLGFACGRFKKNLLLEVWRLF